MNPNEVLDRVPFDYVVGGTAAAPLGSTLTLSIALDADREFEWVWIVGSRTSPLLTVLVTDGATGKTLSNGPIDFDNWAGTGPLPFPLVEPWVLAPGSTLTFNFVNNSTALNVIQIVLRGYKLQRRAA